MSDKKDSIFELGDKLGVKSPFGDWLKKNERQQSDLPNLNPYSISNIPKRRNKVFIQKEQKYKIDKVFFRLGLVNGKEDNSLYELLDENGKPQKFGEKDNDYEDGLSGEKIVLFPKVRVAKIEDRKIRGIFYKRVILFWKGRYREGFLHQSLFREMYVGNEFYKHDINIFINDAERLLFEFEIRFQRLNLSKYPIPQNAYSYLKEEIIKIKEKVKDDPIFARFAFQTSKELYYGLTEIYNDENHLQSLTKTLNFIGINEELSNHIHDNNIVIPPISDKWIENQVANRALSMETRRFFESLYSTVFYASLSGDSGEVKSFSYRDGNIYDSTSSETTEGMISYFINILPVIKKEKRKGEIAEVKWFIHNEKKLREIHKRSKYLENQIHDFNPKNKIPENGTNGSEAIFIFIQGGTWKLPRWSSYASSIGIQHSFGPIYSIPILSVLLHEMDQNILDYIPLDTHIHPGATLEIVEEIISQPLGYFASNIIYDDYTGSRHFKSDVLYQSNLNIGLIFLQNFIKKFI